MANNYQESSSLLKIPQDKIAKVQAIIDRVVAELEYSEGVCGCQVELQENGVWFYGSENCNVEHIEKIAIAIIEELEIDEPFYCSWSYTCSKPRIDEFGGGAFVIRRGHDTYWVDAMNHVQEYIRQQKTS